MEKPPSVPAEAVWSDRESEWVLATKDDEERMHGRVTNWRPDGTLVNHCDYAHGVPHGAYERFHQSGEVSREGTFADGQLQGTDVFHRTDATTTEHFPQGLPTEVWRAEMDMVHGRVVAARCYDRKGSPIPVTEDLDVGAWLLGALDGADGRAERLRVARAITEVLPTPAWGVFTDSGRKRFEARQMAFDTLARDALARGEDLDAALAWADEAIDCDHHYGHDGPRVTKALVLEKLGREAEALALARRLLAKNPEMVGLEGFRARAEVGEWVRGVSLEGMTVEGAVAVLGGLEEVVGALIGEEEIAHAYDHDHDHEDEDEDEDEVAGERDVRVIVGEALSPELGAFCGLMGRFAVRGGFSAPAVHSVGEALAMEDGNALARFRSIFCAMSPILAEDEGMYFASWWGDARGQSRVYFAHQDEWEVARVAGSIASFLVGRMPAGARARKAASLIDADASLVPSALDPEKLQSRVDWLVDVFMGLQGGDGPPFAAAAGLDAWRAEKALVPAWPHLQAYWLLSHAVFDNRGGLAEALAMTDGTCAPAVLELRRVARALVDDGPVDVPFWDEPRIRGARETALRGGHRHLFEPAALARIEAESAAFQETDRAADEALAALRAAGQTDALELWDVLQSAGGVIPSFEQQCARAWFKNDEEHRMRLFTAQKRGHAPALTHMVRAFMKDKDATWAPVFRAKILRGAGFESEHQANAPGALAGLGAALGSYAAFVKELATFSFHPDRHDRLRRLEHALVAEAYWDESEAPKAFLRAEAKRWAQQIDAWTVDTSNAAINVLFEKNDAAGHEIANDLLRTATFSDANWNACVGLCIACGKLGVATTAPGLARAVAEGLGRHDDADRGRVLRAYALAAGKAAIPSLEGWLASADVEGKSCERAALLGALLVVDGENPARVRAALGQLDEMLGREVGAMEVGAAHALAQGLVDAKIPGAKERVARIVKLAKAAEGVKKSVLKELDGFLAQL